MAGFYSFHFYRIVQLEGTYSHHLVQLPDHSRASHKLKDVIMGIVPYLEALPPNTDRPEALTTSPWSLFQCLSSLSVQKCCLMSSINLTWHSFLPLTILECEPTASKLPWLSADEQSWHEAPRYSLRNKSQLRHYCSGVHTVLLLTPKPWVQTQTRQTGQDSRISGSSLFCKHHASD